jgi:hypothetical protein
MTTPTKFYIAKLYDGAHFVGQENIWLNDEATTPAQAALDAANFFHVRDEDDCDLRRVKIFGPFDLSNPAEFSVTEAPADADDDYQVTPIG